MGGSLGIGNELRISEVFIVHRSLNDIESMLQLGREMQVDKENKTKFTI